MPLGSSSTDCYRQYRDALDAYYATALPDSASIEAQLETLIATDPGWAHPYSLLALVQGMKTPVALRTVEAGRRNADPARDATGIQLLHASALIAGGDLHGAYQVLTKTLETDPTDLHARAQLLTIAVALQRTDEVIAASRRLHADRPDLMFGCDLAESFRRSGRDAAAEAVIRDWIAGVPGNATARVELVRILANSGRTDEAATQARELVATQGHRDDVLPELFEAALAADQIETAHGLADRMLLGSALTRARGRYRAATVAVFEGKFAAAFDSVRRGVDEHRQFGYQSELVQCLELARALAPLVADRPAERRYTVELAETFETLLGDAATAAATRFELALLERPTGPPSIDQHLAPLADESIRDVARRRMLRAAAVVDCGSPHKAVAAGFSAFEENTASLVAFGLCAWKLEEHELARRSFERASRLWSSTQSNQNSPYHAILARFHLAGVLADLGEIAESRAHYETFLRCWGDADRPIREVSVARRMLHQK